jgi:hypothetical protein
MNQCKLTTRRGGREKQADEFIVIRVKRAENDEQRRVSRGRKRREGLAGE